MSDPNVRAQSAHPLSTAIVEQHATLLAYVGRRLPRSLRSTVDPADVVQDACCEALRHAGRFRPDKDPTGRRWLFTIARRRITRLAERHRIAPQWAESGMRAGSDPQVGVLEQLAVSERTPSQSAIARERRDAVWTAVGKLSAEHAAVLRDRYVDDMPAKVVAERMGRSPAAVDKLVQRASKAFREQLRD